MATFYGALSFRFTLRNPNGNSRTKIESSCVNVDSFNPAMVNPINGLNTLPKMGQRDWRPLTERETWSDTIDLVVSN